MTTLSTGVLLKLLDGMKSGAAKPVGDHRTAVLQVTDIVPADMDEKDLFPRHGQFYVKVSDSSHSIYATLPLAQADLVLTNKLSLGQFVHVDRLDPGSPVPVIVGARPLPGRHPLVVGTPEPPARGKAAAPRRGSWGPENHAVPDAASPKVAIKPTALNFDERTPVKASPARSSTASASVRKSSSVLPRLMTRSRSCFVADRGDPPPKIPKSPFPAEKSSMSCTAASRPMSRRVREEEPSSLVSDDDTATSAKKRPSAAARVPLPGKVDALGKEAMEQREKAQKAALEALRNASATENVARIYKMFSELSKAARPDAPAACFESFLGFHQEAVQAVADIESIQAATSMAASSAVVASDEPPADEAHVLQEIAQNRTTAMRRRGGGLLGGLGGVSKSVSFAPGTLLDPSFRHDGGRSLSARRKCLAVDKIAGEGDEKRPSVLGSSLRLAKQMQTEAGSWFMEFLEAALETGLKKKRSKASLSSSSATGKQSGRGGCCPQSLMLRVINWVEMEQSGDSRKAGHPRAAAIARKLRIKAKNP